jgi:hypothetical protein
MYEKQEPKKSASWAAVADKASENINIFYKQTPVTKISLASIGVPKEDANIVCNSISSMLDHNNDFLKSMLEDLPEEERFELYRKHSELRK